MTFLGVGILFVLLITIFLLVFTQSEATQYASTSQHSNATVQLVNPLQSPVPLLAAGGGEIDIVDEVALRPIMSPLGDTDGTVWVDTQGQIAKYLVRPGDTIGHIAEMYSVSVETIRTQNDIGPKEYIRAGDILEILPVDGVQYIVQSGDTLEKIAQRYKVKPDDIAQYNNISNNELAVDSSLIIPQASSESSPGTSQEKPRTTKKRIAQTEEHYDIGPYIFPCDCIVTQGYGSSSFARRSGYYAGDFHGGVDFSSGEGTGTPIVAVDRGTVTKVASGYNGGYGNYVIVQHADGRESLYAHNSRNAVSVGQVVKQGQIIAYMGTTGRVTGPHVHFELRNVADSANPFYTTFSGRNGW